MTTEDEGATIVLLDEPEIYVNPETGETDESYQFDGSEVAFSLDKDEGVVFQEFTFRLIKSEAGALTHFFLEVMDLTPEVLVRLGEVTGPPEEFPDLAEDEALAVRFELKPGPRFDRVAAAVAAGGELEAFLGVSDDAELPILFDLANYATESVIVMAAEDEEAE